MRNLLLLAAIFASLTGFSQVNANFSMGISSGCSPLVVNFTDQSTGPVTSWAWDFGNGNGSNQQNPAAAYLNPGVYTVRLIVSDGISFDTMTWTSAVTVFADPQPFFSPSTVIGCSPLNVQFTDLTILGDAPIQSYIWDFGDGTNSSLPNPSHTYTNPGTFGVTMIVTDTNGCSTDTVSPGLITVVPRPTADFTGSPRSGCVLPHQVNFTDNSSGTGLMTYFWNFGDGNTSVLANPTHSYSSFGNYTVTLIVTDGSGCSDTIVRNNYVQVNNLTADFSASQTQVCLGQSITFSDQSSPLSTGSTWFFGDGDSSTALNPSHTYTSPGTYTVTLQASTNGCSASETKVNYITVIDNPTANFTANITASCGLPLTVNFTDQSTGAVSWHWDFGDGDTSNLQNPSHTYTSGSSFTVRLTVTNAQGCTDQFQIGNYINIIPPNAAFNADTTSGCVPLTVQFTDQSSSPNNIVSWFWDFGDGNTSMLQNPAHTYTSQGLFDVSLIMIDDQGCTDTIVMPAYIMTGDTVHVDFTALDTVLCIEEAAIFVNLSDTSATTTWFWQFGDGQTSMDFEPTYQYSDTGYWTVSLTAINNGCRVSTEKIDFIYISPPDARFEYVVNCANPYEISFTNTSLAPDIWNWDFGTGGDSSYVFSPTFVFPDTGVYDITLWVADTTEGCDDSETRSIYVADPLANFVANPTFGCNPLSVQFTDMSVQANSWFWDFGDGNTSAAQNPNHVYTVNDTFTVTLVVTDVNGCTDTLVRPDYIIVVGPTANFIGVPNGGCRPLIVQFNDQATTLNNNIVSWQWYFGDGDSSTAQNPLHTYDSTGYYDVSLTVTDDLGCQHTRTRNQYIHVTEPEARFFATDRNLCPGEVTQFRANGSQGYQLSYQWFFGDGTSAGFTIGNKSYSQPGVYTVTLVVTDGYGCTDTLTAPNYITVSQPTAAFYGNPLSASCPPLQVNFFDTTFNGSATGWHWDFGDNTSSTLQNPSHVYTEPGSYDVRLIITTDGGCTDTILKTHYVNVSGPNGTYVIDEPLGCVDHTVTFSGVTTNASSVIWDFGDGSVVPGGDTITHTYTTPGVFLPLMILNDGLGCTYVVDLNDTIRVGQIQASFSSLPPSVCLGGQIAFDGTASGSPPVQSYSWEFGDGNTANIEDPVHTYTSAGYYDVTFIVQNAFCIDSLTIPQAVFVDPGPSVAFDVSDTASCAPASIQFTDRTVSDSAIVSWNWDFGDGNSSVNPNPSHTYTNPGVYTISLVVTNSNGCTDSAARNIIIHPEPIASAGLPVTICMGDSVQLSGSGGGDYSWSPGAMLADSEIPNPIAFPVSTTTFTLTVTNQFGCTDTDTVTVSVVPLPVLNLSSDTASCRNEPVTLSVSGALSYQWTPSIGLNCDTCNSVIATPLLSQQYSVTGIGLNNCSSEDSVLVTIHPNPTGLAFGDTTFCQGDSARLLAIGGSSYQWSPGIGLSCTNCPNPLATPSDTTQYQVVVENIFGCETVDQVTVNVVAYPHLSPIPDQTICVGDTAWVNSPGAQIYQWTPATDITCTQCPDPGFYPNSNTTYYLLAGNGFGCLVSDSVNVIVNPVPQVEAGTGGLVCQGVSLNLQGSGNALFYEWTPSSGLSTAFDLSTTATPDTTTVYTLTGWNQFNCSSSDTVSVRVIPGIDISLDTAFDICEGESVQLPTQILAGPNDPIDFVWTPAYFLDLPQTQNPEANPHVTTTYTVIASSGNCRPDTATVTVTVHSLPWVNAGQDQTVVAGTTVQLFAEGSSNVTMDWTPDDGFSCDDCFYPEFTAYESGSYNAMVTDEWGCTAEDSVYVRVIEKCEGDVLFVPSAFTPNGDGNNDYLRVRSIGLQGISYFRVFDRWGNLVFETNDIEQSWDGIYKGSPVNGGVFVWVVKAICSNGEETIQKGNVTVLR